MMLGKFFSKLKFLITPVICTMLGLVFCDMVFGLINVGNVGFAFSLIFADLTIMAILGFMLFSHLKGNKEWFRLTVIIFLSYTFVSVLKGLFSSMAFVSGAHWLYVVLGIFELLATFALSIVAVALFLTMVVKKERFEKIVKEIIDYALLTFFGLVSLVFILTVVGACVKEAGVSWTAIPSVLYDFSFALLFALLYHYDDNVKTGKEKGSVAVDKKVEDDTASDEKASKTEDVTEEAKKEEIEEKTEEVTVVEQEKPAKKSTKRATSKKPKTKKDSAKFEGGVVEIIGPAGSDTKKNK